MFLTDHVINRTLVERKGNPMKTKPWLQVNIFRRAEQAYSKARLGQPEVREQKINRLIMECRAIALADAQREASDAWVYDVRESSVADS